MAPDLFSFLDDNDDDENLETTVDDSSMDVENAPSSSKQEPPLKRKAGSPPQLDVPIEVDEDSVHDNEVNADATPLKKQRIGSPKPVVLDDFETEAKREVAASAGLTGSAVESGSRLELRHQVRCSSSYIGTHSDGL